MSSNIHWIISELVFRRKLKFSYQTSDKDEVIASYEYSTFEWPG